MTGVSREVGQNKEPENRSDLQDGHDDAANHEGQEELPAPDNTGFAEASDEEGQRADEVNGRHGNHGSFGRVRRDVGSVAAAVATTVATAVATVTSIAPVPTVPRPVGSRAVSGAICHSILHVPHESGGHAGKYRHAQDDHRPHHRLDDPRRRQPFVEMLRFVLHVVGSRWRRVHIVIALRALEAAWRSEAIVGRRGVRRAVHGWAVVALFVKHGSGLSGAVEKTDKKILNIYSEAQ